MILHLTLTRKWFDLIASGEKKSEYREIKDYWTKRLLMGYFGLSSPEQVIEFKDISVPMPYDQVHFKNGYAKDSPEMTLECKGIRVGEGKPEWGAEPGKQYFIIELGEKL